MVLKSNYKNFLLEQLFVKKIQKKGKLFKSKKILNKTFKLINKKNFYNNNILEIIIKKLKFSIKLIYKRVLGSVYQIPIKISLKKSISLAIKLILISINKQKKNMKFDKLLYLEFLNILNNEGLSLQQKHIFLKKALSFRVFSHLIKY
uniref:30S ribosomal protein S7 n=1 Tax=Nephromyces sp. ex Molgula occidentalis TaxID=2544991 RepID=A0A5C1H7T8_9APIC|nr:30S ribosomal protein S7 [Nephromyces sp. ex Molgula occidentalis]